MIYKDALILVTTNSIDSPMGLGSDQVPVRAYSHSEGGFPADSTPLTLKYVLRLEEELTGAYYIGRSFHGGNAEEICLYRSYQADCKLLGTPMVAVDVAEHNIPNIVQAILRKHAVFVLPVAETIVHTEGLIPLIKANGGHFSRITLSEALSLNEINKYDRAWEHVVPTSRSIGCAITRIGKRILVAKFGGAVWLIEMDHLSVPFYQAFVPNTNKPKATVQIFRSVLVKRWALGSITWTPKEVSEALKMHEVSRSD